MAEVPQKVAFFVCTATLRKILTIDNLRKRYILIINWCCICISHGESTDNLLLHWPLISVVFSFVFTLLRLAYVMPKSVCTLIECWQG